MIKCAVKEGGYIPTKAHDIDAGFDIKTPVSFVIEPGTHVFIDSLVSVETPVGYSFFVKSKSGLDKKYGIKSEGVIDAGYTGTIGINLYNFGKDTISFKAGEKISQIVLVKISEENEMELVASLEDTERGFGGFGSTGK